MNKSDVQQITPPEYRTRQSNFEALRIIAMFMVLVLHANYNLIGGPTSADILDHPASSFARMTFEALAICAVDVFVMISGWFGIKPSVKGFGGFIFQVLYTSFLLYFIFILFGFNTLNIEDIRRCLLLSPDAQWFIISYIGLYVLSPVLNAFIEKASTKQLGLTVLLFYTFQSVFCWTTFVSWTEMGYCTFSFIGLYLLSAWLRKVKTSAYRYGWAVYLTTVALNIGLSLLLLFGISDPERGEIISGHLTQAYNSPLVVLNAASLICWVSTWSASWRSKPVNFIAKSAFAVYLVHLNFAYFPVMFKAPLLGIYAEYSGIACIAAIFLFLTATFILAILWDQPRRWVWKATLHVAGSHTNPSSSRISTSG